MLFKRIEPKAKGRRIVIADIHGCIKTLQTLVWDKIQLTKDDQLFFLGDFIDRGPSSSGVLDFIIELIDEHFDVQALRGNHEQNLLEEWQYYTKIKTVRDLETFRNRLTKNNTLDLVRDNGELKTKYYFFLKNLPYYFDLGDYYLVHAGFDLKAKEPFKSYDEMLWTRSFIKRQRPLSGLNQRRVVIGHTVTRLTHIERRISENHQIIALDNGCYYSYFYKDKEDLDLEYLKEKGIGNLCALDLDSLELFIQNCMD